MSSTVSIPSPDVVGLATNSGLTVAASPVLLGRTTAGAGAIEELTAGTSLSLSSGTLNTVQDIRTTATPQFTRMGIGAVADAQALLTLAGQSTVPTPLAGTVLHVTNFSGAGGIICIDTDSSANPSFMGRRALGTFSSPSAVTTDTILWISQGRGWTSAGAYSGAAPGFRIVAAEGYTSTAQGAYLSFNTVNTGSTSAAEAARFNADGSLSLFNTTDATAYNAASVTLAGGLGVAKSAVFNGNVGVGGPSIAGAGIYVASPNLSGSTQYGLVSNAIFTSGTTALGVGVASFVSTAAAAFTMTDAKGIWILNASKGAGSAITNNYGLYVDAISGGATINRAIHTAGGDHYFGGAVTTAGAITTAAPTGGTAAAWKFGIYVAGAPSATGYVQLDIGGTLYKLLTST